MFCKQIIISTMKKYRIKITHEKHNYRVDLLELVTFPLVKYWRKKLTQRGSLQLVSVYIQQWCDEFWVDKNDVEDLTKTGNGNT